MCQELETYRASKLSCAISFLLFSSNIKIIIGQLNFDRALKKVSLCVLLAVDDQPDTKKILKNGFPLYCILHAHIFPTM